MPLKPTKKLPPVPGTDIPPGMTVSGPLKISQDVKSGLPPKVVDIPYKAGMNRVTVYTDEIRVRSNINFEEIKRIAGQIQPVHKPGGFDPTTMPQILKNLMLKDMEGIENAEFRLNQFIRFSSTQPKRVLVQKPITLYKLVKVGGKKPSQSNYWVTEAVIQHVIATGKAESRLGLPIISWGEEYEVYKITLDTKALEKGIPIFESGIAPTIESIYRTEGGSRQIFVPNMDMWNIPIKTQKFTLKKR